MTEITVIIVLILPLISKDLIINAAVNFKRGQLSRNEFYSEGQEACL